MLCGAKIRVLVVDDSAIVRKILSESLNAHPDIEVIATAPDPYVARDKILELDPDVLTLDIEMPRMDGLTFFRKLMQYRPMPVIVISSISSASCQTAMEAMRLGAVEVLAKPSGPYSVGDLRLTLAMKIRAASTARITRKTSAKEYVAPAPVAPFEEACGSARFSPGAVIAIGASTGGTQAVEQILLALPPDSPGILVTQHIPPGFSTAFAKRLDQITALEVKEAEHGDYVVPGRILVAPGDRHMLLRKSGAAYRVGVRDGPRVCYQRPSVDVLFASVADTAGAEAVGVILTGMGSDGAEGMKKMKVAGAHNIAQDEASCVVFGMPKEAIRAGAVNEVLPLRRIAAAALKAAARHRGLAGPDSLRQLGHPRPGVGGLPHHVSRPGAADR